MFFKRVRIGKGYFSRRSDCVWTRCFKSLLKSTTRSQVTAMISVCSPFGLELVMEPSLVFADHTFSSTTISFHTLSEFQEIRQRHHSDHSFSSRWCRRDFSKVPFSTAQDCRRDRSSFWYWIVVFGLSRFPVGLSPFFVFCFLLERWWQIGDGFVGLARLNFFVSRWVCATFVSDFCFRVFLSVWLSQFFCFSGAGGIYF